MVFKKFSEFENYFDVGEYCWVCGGGFEMVYDKVRRDYVEKFFIVDCKEESSRILVVWRDLDWGCVYWGGRVGKIRSIGECCYLVKF